MNVTSEHLRSKARFADELGYRDHASLLRDAAETIDNLAVRSALVDVPAVESEPAALIEREVLAELAKHKTATGTVCSPLLKSKFGDKVPLFAHRPLSTRKGSAGDGDATDTTGASSTDGGKNGG